MSESTQQNTTATFHADLDQYIADEQVSPLFHENADNKKVGKAAFDFVCDELSRSVYCLSPDTKKQTTLTWMLECDKRGGVARTRLYNFCLDIVNGAIELPIDDLDISASEFSDDSKKGIHKQSQSLYRYQRRAIDEIELDLFIQQNKHNEGFADLIFHFMDEKGMTRPEVYRNADLSRQDFSRMTSPKSKGVSRIAVFNLAIGLRLGYDETKQLLRSAGYAYNKSNKFDLIIMFCIKQQVYDTIIINELLYERTGKTLISSYEPNVNDKDIKD